MPIRSILLFFTLLIATSLSSQNAYERFFLHQDSASYGLCVAQTTNNRYAVGGYIASESTPGAWDGAVWVVNAQGDISWSRKFRSAGGGPELITDIISDDAGNLFATYIASNNAGSTSGGVIKIGPDGALIWAKDLISNDALFEHITATSEGYLITGASLSNPPNAALALEINDQGTALWQRIYNSSTAGADMALEADVFTQYFCGFANDEAMLTQINSASGGLNWTRTYGSASPNDYLDLMTRLPDGNLILAGATSGFSNDNYEVWVVKTRPNGDMIWSKTYSIASVDMAPFDILPFSNGNFMLAVSETGAITGNGAVLLTISGEGDLIDQKSYGPLGADARFSAVVPAHGVQAGYFAAGSLVRNGQTGLFAVKTDPSGNVPVCCPKSVSFGVVDVTAQTQTAILSMTASLAGSLGIEQASFTPFSTDMTELCPQIDVAFQINDNNLCPGECTGITFPNPTPGVSYSWTFPGGTPSSSTDINPAQICYFGVGTYAVILNANGCTASDTSRVEVGTDPADIPNAFSPDNGDMINDVFRPILNCPVEEYQLEIWNRWGDLIFESIDPSENGGWDGTVNGYPAPPDTYVYRVSYYTYVDGVRTLIKNEMKEVTLLR